MICMRLPRIRRCAVVLLLTFAVIWTASLAWCEYLTARWGEQFQDGWREVSLLNQPDRWKVLSYTKSSACVYYAGESAGETLTFVRDGDGPWTCCRWRAVWSDSGSADGFVWPYIR